MSEVGAVLPRSAISWLVVEGRPWPVWHAVDGSRLYVVSGPDEQQLPVLPEQIEVILRTKDTRARVGPVPASAFRLRPGVPAWEPAITALMGARQGAPGQQVLDRWKASCAVWAIDVDVDAPVPQPGATEPSGARPPEQTPATTDRWRPRHFGRLRRRH